MARHGLGDSGFRGGIPIVFSILRKRSIRFIEWSVRRLSEYLESHCSSGHDADHGDFLRVLPPFHPELDSPGTLRISPATCLHFASERTEPCSYDYFTSYFAWSSAFVAPLR